MTIQYQSPVRIIRAASNEVKKLKGEEQLNRSSLGRMATLRASGADDACGTFQATAHTSEKDNNTASRTNDLPKAHPSLNYNTNNNEVIVMAAVGGKRQTPKIKGGEAKLNEEKSSNKRHGGFGLANAMMKLDVPSTDFRSVPKPTASRYDDGSTRNPTGDSQISQDPTAQKNESHGDQVVRYRGRYGSNLA